MTGRGLLSLFRRRLWLFVVCAVVVPLVAIGVSSLQGRKYDATASAIVEPNVQLLLVGARDPALYQPGADVVLVNAGLAPRASIARAALDDAGLPRRSPSSLLSALTVTPSGNRIDFQVRDSNAGDAERLATAYARRFTAYRHQLHIAAVRRVRRGLLATMTALSRTHRQSSHAYITAQYLFASMPAATDVRVTVQPARAATVASPRPAEVAVAGVVTGIFLAALLAIALPRNLALRRRLGRRDAASPVVSPANRASTH